MKVPNSTSAGVYLFRDKKKTVLYVGKAANLSSRLRSYFQKDLLPRQEMLMEQANNVEIIEVDSEFEALLLEANLIKKYLPDFNVQLKDDKDYLYLKIVKEPFPRVLLARKKGLADAREYFGPYPSASSLRSTLKSLRRIFPFRTCKLGQNRACFYYHIGLCPGVCIGAISEKDYLANIRKLKLFLEGQKGKVVKELEDEMKQAAKNLEFEKAEKWKKRIEAINYITRSVRRVDEYIEAGSQEQLRKKELSDLAVAINQSKYFERIECYDISNFQGSHAVGSMIVFTDGKVDKSQYRRFKIRDFSSPNDPGMMGEMLRRRLKNEWPLPDLIVVDGGKTQLGAVHAELEKAEKNIPLIGLAKKNEEIYTLEGTIIRLPKNSQALYLLQRVRDEAHRFAISYYRKLASKTLTAN